MNVLGFRHTGIVVKDMAAALGFYRDLCGFDVLTDGVEGGPFIERLVNVPQASLRIVKLRVPGPLTPPRDASPLPMFYGGVLELLQFLKPEMDLSSFQRLHKAGISHLALAVNDVDTLYADWSRRGVQFNHAPERSPGSNAKVAYAHDPDGTVVELVELKKG